MPISSGADVVVKQQNGCTGECGDDSDEENETDFQGFETHSTWSNSLEEANGARLRFKTGKIQGARETWAENPIFQFHKSTGSENRIHGGVKGQENIEARLRSSCHLSWRNFLQYYYSCHAAKGSSSSQPPSLNNNIKKTSLDAETETKYAVICRTGKGLSSASLTSPSDTTTSHCKKLRKGKRGSRSGENKLEAGTEKASSNPYKLRLTLLSTLLIMFLKVILVSFLLMFVFYCFMVLHKPTQAFVSRHTQDWIYPFMRSIRFAALPFIYRFPQFHELYEDACLLSNPYFEMSDVSCWPCESVRHVIDLTGFSNFTSGYYHSGVPFIVKDAFSRPVTLHDIHAVYKGEEKLSGSILLRSSDSSINSFQDLTLSLEDINRKEWFKGLQVAWKSNRAQYARLMRRHFSRPYYIPNSTEISVQHFLFADGPLADQYPLPVTEFANVFVMQAEGCRLIVLVPVKNCRLTCKAISVVLQPKDVLFYNWLFWRPISFPITSLHQSNSHEEGQGQGLISVAYVGSFY